MKVIGIIFKYLSVAVVLTIFVGPMIWVGINSLKPTPELLGTPSFLPKKVTFEHYKHLFNRIAFLRYYRNSFIVGVVTATVTAVAGAFAAYSIFRCKYPGRGFLYRFFISSYVFPKVLVLVPLYIMFSKIGIIDTPLALVAAHVMLIAPFSVWILRAFFQNVPVEIEEAALIDGAGRVQTIFKIFIPLAAPGIAAIWINAFLMSWSEYLFASTLVISDSTKTLPVGMAYFLQEYAIEWGIMMAGSVLIAIPPIIGFAFAGKYFVQGLTAGGIKE
ncbi:MAG: carbohydrate ABC transporter permease [Thermococcus sp.]|nr:carbohydrate ABC transporter permease [Thermococcus sp.]